MCTIDDFIILAVVDLQSMINHTLGRIMLDEDVWEMKNLPNRLTVVGGGPIGCELAQAFSRLGSKVTIVASKLLPKEEPEVDEILREVFEEEIYKCWEWINSIERPEIGRALPSLIVKQ